MVFNKTPIAERAKPLQRALPKGEAWTVPIPGTEREGRSPLYRHWLFQDALLTSLDPDVLTAHDFFEQSAAIHGRNRCLGHRPWNPSTNSFENYVWQDYQTVARRRSHVGTGIIHALADAGITKRNIGVGLWCQNRPEWQLVDLGCMSQSLFTVSLYDTLGPNATEFIIAHAELHCVVTSVNHMPTLIQLKATGNLPDFKIIICMDPLDEGDLPGMSKGDLLRGFAEKVDLKIYSLEEIERRGEESPLPFYPPKPEDIVTINYTSGTTGNPKGVVLTHLAAVSSTSSALISVKQSNTDVFLSYLPLAHIFERICQHAALWAGASIAYFHGSIPELLDDVKLARPTTFAGVPRVYNRFGSAIRAATVEAPGFRGRLSRYVVDTKLAVLNRPEDGSQGERSVTHPIWDRVWGRKVSSAIGLDRCATLVTGSAPIDGELQQFLRVVFGSTFSQGYGLTETYGCVSVQMPDDLNSGSSGGLAPSMEAILVDVPDMGYTTRDKPFPRGELWVRGTNLMKEYFKNPEETQKAVDEEGWLHTGDIAQIDDRGRINIVDRVKNFLKLSFGEYISPEKIENTILAELSWLASLFIHGDGTQACLVAIAGVDPLPFAAWWKSKTGEDVDTTAGNAEITRLLQRKDVEEQVIKAFDRACKKVKLNKFEYPKGVRLFIEPFTIENELLTPTLKLKRPQTVLKYREAIDGMYGEIARKTAAPKSLL